MLRRAVQLADAARSSALQVTEVAKAFGDIKIVRRKYLLDRLTPHHRIIVELIERQPGIDSVALWQEYQVECEKLSRSPVMLRTFQSYVARLAQLKLIRSEPRTGDGTARVFYVA